MTTATSNGKPHAYSDFLASKSQLGGRSGFAPVWMPDFLFDFQRALLDWSIRKGRASIFADCGLDKTPMQLVWAENVVRHTNKPVLIVTPLAVSAQTVREAGKFGIEVHQSRDGKVWPNITVTNYERLHYFTADDFSGIVCDESSVLKSFDGVRRAAVTEFMRRMPYRLLCTATAAPNDYVELGTSSEALGELGNMDMLARFFVCDAKSLHILGQKHGDFTKDRWRFKSHAESHFWRWVCSWARACRKPSDLGFSDGSFRLPELVTHETVVKATKPAPGMLFEKSAESMAEQREETRRTLPERCHAAAGLVNGADSAVVWCQLNDEGDLLEKLIPGAKQVTGSDSDEEKEETFAAFAAGHIPVLVTKPKIGGFGLNWQHCNRMTFFPSHSFEQYYQAVRRCWRFGQKRPVRVDVVTTEGGAGALASLKRKSEAADEMFAKLVSLMNNSLRVGRSAYGDKTEEVPSWL